MSHTMPSMTRRTAHFGQMSKALQTIAFETVDDVTPRPA